MAPPTSRYEPRHPAHSTLYTVVLEHVETFRLQAGSLREGEGLPRFVEQEFRDFLTCGCLAGGFARFRCDTCGHDRLVPLSCKGRGFCPSCGGRRTGCDGATACDRGASGGEASGRSRARRPEAYLWADLMRRTFGFDVLACPRCGGRLRLPALMEHASTVDGLLRHLGLPIAVPEPRPARAPPAAVESAGLPWDDAPTA